MLAMAALLASPGGALAVSCGSRCQAVRAPGGIGGALAPGPGGSVWVAERGHVLRLGPRGGSRRVAAPVGAGSDLAPGPGGSVWFAALGGRIGRVSRSGRVTLFAAHVSRVGGLAPAPGGGVWFTAPEGVGLLSAAGVANVVPVPGAGPGVRRHSIATGPDGTPSFLLDSPPGIGHLEGGIVTRLGLGGSFGAGARAIAAGPDGGMWFTSPGAMAVGRIGADGGIASFPTSQTPYDLISGPSGALWVTMKARGPWSIVRLTPSGFATYFQVHRRVAGLAAVGGGVAIAERGAVERLAPFLGARPVEIGAVARNGAVGLRLYCPQYDLVFCAGTIELRWHGRVLASAPFSQRVNDAPVTRLVLTPGARALVRRHRSLTAVAVIDQHDQGGAHRRSSPAVRLRWL
jgi:virginiamycin B lyase